jgi:ribulose 1,5-bisphosphate synthetase/thiazole synthase
MVSFLVYYSVKFFQYDYSNVELYEEYDYIIVGAGSSGCVVGKYFHNKKSK